MLLHFSGMRNRPSFNRRRCA